MSDDSFLLVVGCGFEKAEDNGKVFFCWMNVMICW